MSGNTVLITGASGFTGEHLIRAATAAGLQCHALCRTADESVPDAAATFISDLADPKALADAVRAAQPDYVVHLAAVSFVAHGSVSDMYRTNVEGAVNLATALANEAPQVKKVVIASSANIYGRSATLPITEDSPILPVNHYGVSKAAMEQALRLFRELPIAFARPFNYTGVGQSSRFVVPKVVEAFRRKAPSLELGNIDVSRDFSDVRDICRGYVNMLNADTDDEVMNMCSGAAHSVRDIIEQLQALSGHEFEVLRDPALFRAEEIPVLYGDSGRFDRLLGGVPRIPLRDTLLWMLEGNAAPARGA